MMNIAALLSGGVDSSVVVHLLCEQGYKPTLFYIKIGMDGAEYMDCSAEEDIEMSTAIARKYGLSLEVVDLHKEYWENVAAYAIDKIKKGLTPNPDVMCNKLIKFGCFEQQVGKNFDFTATGHYATTIRQDGKTWLGTAKDPVKDQTDFLAQIDYLQVSKLMFPIGGLMKQEVREIASRAGLPSARRKDSQGISSLIEYNKPPAPRIPIYHMNHLQKAPASHVSSFSDHQKKNRQILRSLYLRCHKHSTYYCKASQTDQQ